ncbi:serine/threonine-protein kinase [Paraliomyxa miuraensis]|uniref:serine/threonine-protein kinase n=1 Tax=Paraliomyxa miuraensis TaxID=376150 RepID=UPI0022520F93|nr:serine/threonine-protein kinase [Paraliomyxa miuraensis]MCX4241508.1 protein kinase [Paraliomyxa miuraensis]
MSSKPIVVPRVRRLYRGPSATADGPTAAYPVIPVVPGYRILGHVASGGMGNVYAATSLRTHRKVALKLVRPENHTPATAERILREVRALSGLSHPGIVEYVDHGTTPEGIPYLAMEWLDGVDLDDRLHHGPLSIDDALALAVRVAEALAAAHEHGVIHRDIKPSNIFLVGGRPSDARLLDFGVARLLTHTWTLTLPGKVIGTPDYMSPEQARGAPDLDPRADLFSLGCVLHECLCGEPAFVGEHVMAVLAKVLMENPPRLGRLVPEIPVVLEEIVARLLEKDRERRIGNARELAQRLRSLVDGNDEPLELISEALTQDEQVLCSVLFFRGRSEDVADPIDLTELAKEHLGHDHTLVDGTRLIVMDCGGAASDQAATTARCALALRERAPHYAIAVASGHGIVTGRSIMGQVLDRGADLLLRGRPGNICIDDVTASLLDPSFEVADGTSGLTLVAVRDTQSGTRRLLGKKTPLVGRRGELAHLEAVFAECCEELCAAAVLMIGNAGAGKSRLRHELDARLRSHPGQPVTTFLGRADPMRTQAPLSLMSRVLCGAASLEDGEPTAIRQHKLRTRIARHVGREEIERVTLYLGELVSAYGNDAPLELRLAREDSASLRARIREAWVTWLRAESNASPVLFVLEDLHWADAATVQLMDTLLEQLEGQPILVLALARPTVHDLFPELWKHRDVETLELSPLAPRAARKLVHEVLGDTVEHHDVERIVKGAGGNAFFLEELIRAVADGSGGELPDSVLGMMQARLGSLTSFERKVLRAASVFGETAWQGGIRELLGRDADVEALGPTLMRLANEEWLTPRPRSQIPCDYEYTFRHALVCDAAYATLTDADRRVGHRLAGRWLERAGGQEAVVLAEHFLRGEDHPKATEWFATAADQAFERHEFDVVLQLVERGQRHAVPGEARGRLLLRRTELHAISGRHQEAVEAAMAALEELPLGSARWYSAAGEAALAMSRTEQPWRVGQLIDRLMNAELASCSGAMGLVRAAVPLAAAGDVATSRRLVEKIIDITATMVDEDPEAAATMHSARAMLAIADGDLSQAYQAMEAAANAFESAGSLRNSLEHFAGAGFFMLEVGSRERGEALLRQTIERCVELRLEHVCAVTRHNLGRRLVDVGRFTEGLELELDALASFERHGNQRMMGLTRCHIAWILLHEGRTHEAMGHVDLAIELLEGHAVSRSISRATRAQIHLSSGAPQLALEDARIAIEGLESLDRVQEGESFIRLTWAEALAAAGHLDEARAAILSAKRSVDERARRIDEPELRESFSTRVPENARILQLATQWIELGSGT